jgi:hypothetical protein
MKSKLSKILGVVVTIAVLAGMLVASVPASGHSIFKAQWWAESEPTSSISAKNLIVGGFSIMDVAASGDLVYVAGDNISGGMTLYKSTDGGATFESLENTTFYPTSLSRIKKVVISKEDPDVIAILGSNNNVYYSTNGGSRWTNLGDPTSGGTVNSIDIYGGTTTYVVAGGNAGSVAEVYTYRLALLQNWTARYNGATGAATNQTDIKAVLFSPGFGTEKAILAVSTNGSNQGIFQIFRYETGDTEWNGSVDYLNSTDWGTGIALTPGSTVAGGLATADIAVPSDYLANDDDQRLAFVSTAGVTSGGGVTRLNDVVQSDFDTWSGGEPGPMYSIAYHEDGKLVAGDANENQVYQFLSPTASIVKATKVNALKQPGGSTNTSVVYSGDSVLAGTAGDEGGLALSTDDGYAFNDIALINTSITAIPDFDVSADGGTAYWITNSSGDISVWLKAGRDRFKRVLSLKDETNQTFLVRMAPDDSSAVYLAQLSTKNMWVSKNSGLESWKSVPVYPFATDTIVDFAVESADVVYAVDDDSCSKTSNAGGSWGLAKKPDEGMTPYMITVASNGDVLVAGADGYINYSTDGGSTFARTGSYSGTNAVVVPDDGYADNGIIYVGIGTSVKRGKLSTAPASTRGSTTGYTITGIGQASGVVYVLACNGTESVIYQSLNLETAADSSPYADADWSNDTAVTSDFNAGRNTLKISVSSGMPTLWAIDTSSSDDLESFTDPVSLTAPSITGPADGADIAVNPKSGTVYDVTFTYKKYNDTDINSSTLQIATDPDFNAIMTTSLGTSLSTETQAVIIGPSTGVNYMPGETYYWRVRTTSPLNSPWTATRSFTVASLEDPFAVSGPAVGAGDVSTMPTLTWAEYEGAIKYQVEICELPDFAILELSANTENPFYAVGADDALDYSTTYYWRVRGVTAEPYLQGRSWVTPAGPWITGVFTTMAEPEAPVPDEPDVITLPGKETVKIVEVPVTSSPVIPTYLLWVIVGVGAVLVIALIVLIVRTRRVA